MPYGYLGQNQPNQTVSNSGVFSITDVAELQSQGKLGGSLELIEEQTVSAVSTIDFTSIKENKYDVHKVEWNDLTIGTSAGNYLQLRFSNNGGTSYIASGYQVAMQYGGNNGSFGDTTRSTSANSITYLSYSNTTTSNANQNGYLYLYNLGNSSKYSFLTSHSFSQSTSTVAYFYFGGGVLPTAETHNAFQLLLSDGATITGTIKLYGVKQI
jgi:hypothetical protein